MFIFSLFRLVATDWQMFIFGLVVIFICSTFLFILIRAQRIRTKVEKPLKIMALGFSGVGKTVFLTTMYGKLRETGQEGFSLLIKDKADSKQLSETYEMLENGDFPPSTLVADIKEWAFICQVKGRKETYDVAYFTYLDFPGELVGKIREPEPTSVEERFLQSVSEADILLGMLDGKSVVDYIESKFKWRADEQQIMRKVLKDRGVLKRMTSFIKHDIIKTKTNEQLKDVEQQKPEMPAERFRRELYTLLEALDGKKFKPFYFLLTKWDYVEQRGYTLDQILKYLKEIPRFRTFLQGQILFGNTVRIIPVSSVGKRFFKYKNDESIPYNYLDPFQVEMPLVCILPDFMQVQIDRLKIDQKLWYRKLMSLSGNRWFWLRKLLEIFSRLTFSIQLGILGLSVEIFDRTNFENGWKNMQMPINNKKEALEHVFKNFRRLINDFEKRFPDSRIRDV